MGNARWKKEKDLVYKDYVVRVFTDKENGKIRYEYYLDDSMGTFCDYSYVVYTNEKAKQLLAEVGIETYDSGQGTLGVKIPGKGSTIMFGAGVTEIDKMVEKYAREIKQENEQRLEFLRKKKPMQIKDYLTLIAFLVTVSSLLWLFSS